MHELSLCSNIIDIAVNEFQKYENKIKKVISVQIVVGELHAIVEDNMKFIFNEISKNTVIEGSKLEIVYKPVTIKCNKCNKIAVIKDSNYQCSNCLSGNISLISGKELFIEKMEVDFYE